ncbi:MAG TPA: hypothetical protein VFR05_01955 [Terriglobia bacterium]|nr:hypothetical protein [Terriglobia bacterium]
MTESAAVERMASFFQAVAEARSRLLVIDYEGTLAPSSQSDKCSSPYAGISERLECITRECNTYVVAISGRRAHDVRRMLGTRIVHEIWGDDGLERLHCDGRYEVLQLDVPTDTFEALTESEKALRCLGLGKLLQANPASVSVHWRGMSDLDDILDVRAKACRIFRALAAEYPALRFAEFEGGAELRLRVATKADSFRRLLSGTPANTPVAYVGHDRFATDNDCVLDDWTPAFVMRRLPGTDATQKHSSAGNEVTRFLDEWIGTSRGRL